VLLIFVHIVLFTSKSRSSIQIDSGSSLCESCTILLTLRLSFAVLGHKVVNRERLVGPRRELASNFHMQPAAGPGCGTDHSKCNSKMHSSSVLHATYRAASLPYGLHIGAQLVCGSKLKLSFAMPRFRVRPCGPNWAGDCSSMTVDLVRCRISR
jgi:hypothetical protein